MRAGSAPLAAPIARQHRLPDSLSRACTAPAGPPLPSFPALASSHCCSCLPQHLPALPARSSYNMPGHRHAGARAFSHSLILSVCLTACHSFLPSFLLSLLPSAVPEKAVRLLQLLSCCLFVPATASPYTHHTQVSLILTYLLPTCLSTHRIDTLLPSSQIPRNNILSYPPEKSIASSTLLLVCQPIKKE